MRAMSRFEWGWLLVSASCAGVLGGWIVGMGMLSRADQDGLAGWLAGLQARHFWPFTALTMLLIFLAVLAVSRAFFAAGSGFWRYCGFGVCVVLGIGFRAL